MRGRRRRAVVLAFFRLPGARSFALTLVLFLGVAAAAVALLSIRYGSGADDLSLGQALYAVFNLLFFNAVYPLPGDHLTRLAFYAVPILGLVLLGHVAVRLGAALVDRERWHRAVASTYTDHVIVCGLGRVSFRVCRWLLDLEQDVVVIEHDAANAFLDQVRGWGIPVIVADARRPEILEQAGLHHACAIAPLSSDDVLNLSIATEARALRPDLKVVLRTFEDSLAASLQKGFDIHAAYSTSALAAPAFAAAAMRAPVDHAFAFAGGAESLLLTVTEFTVVESSRLVGYTVGRLEEEFDVRVLAHRRTEFVAHPDAAAALSAGEGIVVSATIESLNRLARLTPPTRYLKRYEEGRWPIETAAPRPA